MPFKDEANIPGVPNYTPAQMRTWALVVASVMSFLAASSIVLRLLSRRIRQQKLWWDDKLIMFSMVWNWVVVAIALAMYAEGVGYHSDTIGPVAVAKISRYLLVSEVIYIWHMAWTKLSVLLMYYRIFRLPYFKRFIIPVGAFVVMWAIAGTFLFTFICVPTEKLWHPEIPGHCISEIGVWVANASSTIVSDIAILVLPIPQVWKLKTKKSEKIGLTVVFGLGFFTVFTSAYRVWVLFNYRKDDVPYTLFPLLVWTDIEMCAAVISACLPTMLPIMQLVGIKLGLRHPRSTKASTDPTAGGDSNGQDNRNPHLQSLYHVPDDTELEDMLDRQLSRQQSKTSWYPPSTVEDMDVRRDEVVKKEVV